MQIDGYRPNDSVMSVQQSIQNIPSAVYRAAIQNMKHTAIKYDQQYIQNIPRLNDSVMFTQQSIQNISGAVHRPSIEINNTLKLLELLSEIRSLSDSLLESIGILGTILDVVFGANTKRSLAF